MCVCVCLRTCVRVRVRVHDTTKLYHPGPFMGPRGRGKAAGRHPWIPYGSRYIY